MNAANNTPIAALAASGDKCTIYYAGGLGMVKLEVRFCAITIRDLSTFDSRTKIVSFRYTASKAYSRPSGFSRRCPHNAFGNVHVDVVVLKGHGHPAPEETNEAFNVGGFDAMMNAHVADGAEVLFDGRRE